MEQFTESTLPRAIRRLFELNHYSVEGPVRIHGAEIDLVARRQADSFAAPIYIEATIEYVDATKYGKDVGKLAMISELDPQAQKLIVSSVGFTAPVKERARASRIRTLTYHELFREFERFEPYISSFLGNTPEGRDLRHLSEIYEEPVFADSHGSEKATVFLSDWKDAVHEGGQWLLVTGEYGTGKTALTRVLLYRWLTQYEQDPSLPLPLRIELRDFTSQFHARGLLHEFLDQNNLSQVSIDFVLSLIREGRAILILDGYDEMAQYLHARERRTCLEALAELSDGGARGIITSRPNYFTEAEELQVYEILYKSLEAGRYTFGRDANALLEKEQRIDRLLEQFIERYERALKDLTPAQTTALIDRVLADDPRGRAVVLGLLKRLFRPTDGDLELSLAGKPVIVSYLLEVVEDLKEANQEDDSQSLTEWQIYKLIVDQLMVRDFKRSPTVLPHRRRQFLQRIALFLSRREHPHIAEEQFRDIVAREFQTEIRRLPKESQPEQLEQLFADLRSSATLTRGGEGSQYSWRFSHNSLREYLVAEALLAGLRNDHVVPDVVTVNDAMRIFAAASSVEELEEYAERLARLWKDAAVTFGRGQLLTLLWDGLLRLYPKEVNRYDACLKRLAGEPPQLGGTSLAKLVLSTETNSSSFRRADFTDAVLSTVSFAGSDLTEAVFARAVFDGVNFENADLSEASFEGALLNEVVFSGAELKGASFKDIGRDAISIIVELEAHTGRKLLSGRDALGYLRFLGAETEDVPVNFVLQFHPAFWVVDKILMKLSTQATRQRRGLEQRGAAHHDVNLAKDFVHHLESKGLLRVSTRRKDLVEVTERGRRAFSKYGAEKEFSPELLSFFENKMN